MKIKSCLLAINLYILFLIKPFFTYAASANCTGDLKNFTCVADIFDRIIGIAVAAATIVLFVMLISGGLKWMTSGGDPKDIENARGRITFSILGLGAMVLVWFILKFIKTFTGVDVTTFSVPY